MWTYLASCSLVNIAVTVDDEIGALRAAVGAKTDMELAELLGVRRSAISQWKARGAVPKKYRSLFASLSADDIRDALNTALRFHVFGKIERSYWLLAALAAIPPAAFTAADESPAERGRRLEGIMLRVMNLAINATNTTLRQDYIRDDAECQRVIDELLESKGEGIDNIIKDLPYTGPGEP